MSFPDNRAELQQLISRHCDGVLEPFELVLLEAMLRDDPAARRYYYQFVALHGELAWAHGEKREHVAADSSAAPVLPGEKSASVPAVRSPVLGFLASVSRRVPGGEFTVGSLLLLVIVAAFWGLSQAILFPRLGGHDPIAESETRNRKSEIEAVATIRETSRVEWSPESQSLGDAGAAIARNHSLSIEAGLIELQLTGGTTLVIEGPAEWKINGYNSATLTRGKLVAKVPRQAVGFKLDTPTASVIDLGTEFGVEVTGQGSVDVQVLAGKVNVHALEAGGDFSQAVRLVAGEAVRVQAIEGTTSPTVERIAADRSVFDELLTRSNSPSALERWRVASRTRRTDAGLVAYYDFEDQDRTLRNTVADQLHGQISLTGDKSVWTQGRWFGKQALVFGEGFATVSVANDTAYRFDGDWSVALWLRLDQAPSATTPILTKGQDPRRQFSLWMFPDRGGLLHLSVNDTTGVNRNVNATVPLELNRWSFVVGTYGGKTLRLFLNGEETGEPITFASPITASDDPLLLGKSIEAIYPHVFTGAIDELASYRRALSSAEVRQLFQTGRPE